MANPPTVWTPIRCPCGDRVCKRFGVSSGVFPTGAGFDPQTAQLVCAAPALLAAAKLAKTWLGAFNHDNRSGATVALEQLELAIKQAEDPAWLPQ